MSFTQKEITRLTKERDGAREALEDRDKMHAEHIQKYEAERLRLLAEKAIAREVIEKLVNALLHYDVFFAAKSALRETAEARERLVIK